MLRFDVRWEVVVNIPVIQEERAIRISIQVRRVPASHRRVHRRRVIIIDCLQAGRQNYYVFRRHDTDVGIRHRQTNFVGE